MSDRILCLGGTNHNRFTKDYGDTIELYEIVDFTNIEIGSSEVGDTTTVAKKETYTKRFRVHANRYRYKVVRYVHESISDNEAIVKGWLE